MRRMHAWLLACAVALAGAMWASAQDEADTQVAQGAQVAEGAKVSPVETGRQVVQGVGEAVTDVGQAVRAGSGEVVETGRKLWQDAVLPMLQRTLAALPGLVKAIVLLLLAWVIARLVGAAVAKVLGILRLDERAAKDWGLQGMLRKPDGSAGSLEQLVGSVVKWIILLIGFVAFFNALDLQMVAGPLQNIVDRIVKIIPNLLTAFVILFAYWIVASLARMGVTRGLAALRFDDRAGKYFPAREVEGQRIGPSALAGRLLFYIILLFGIPPFLQALGQEALVAPLQEMLAKTLAFIPNIIAAAIILFIGNIVAVIVREVVASFLAAAGADQAADRVGISALFGKQKLSGLVAILAYVFILVPIVISALDSLQITAISVPLRNTLETVLAAVPALLVAIVIVFIGYAVATFVKRLVESLLTGLGFDTLPARVGLDFLKPRDTQPGLSAIAGTIVMVIILLLTAQQALARLGFDQLAGLLDRLVRYLPDLAVGIFILLAALSLGRYVGGLVGSAASNSPYATTLSAVARYAIFFLGAGMALDQLGVSQQIVTTAVTAVLGGAALAVGLAFGLGGKDKAKSIIDTAGR